MLPSSRPGVANREHQHIFWRAGLIFGPQELRLWQAELYYCTKCGTRQKLVATNCISELVGQKFKLVVKNV